MDTPITRVLVVEDNAGDLRLLREQFSESGGERFDITAVEQLAEAEARLRGGPFDLVLLDLGLPDSQGMETFYRVRGVAGNAAILILSGLDDDELAARAVQDGAQDYVVKGQASARGLMRAMRHAIERSALQRQLREARDSLEIKVAERTAQIERAMLGTIDSLARMVEAHDPATAGHQRRVADLAAAIGREIGLDADRVQGLRIAGRVLDIGKICVPSEILCKPSVLTRWEHDLVKTHAQAGYDILKDIEFSWPVARAVLQHHERCDGSGYPGGLKLPDILLEARILAVADTVEAMCAHRPYRPALGIDKALEEIEKNRGKLYEPDVVDASLRLFGEKGYKIPA